MEIVRGLELDEISNDRVTGFFSFINEREAIRLHRLLGDKYPWTEDPILRRYRFANVHRDHDKTTQILTQRFYEQEGQSASDLDCLINCATFRFFGRAETALEFEWSSPWEPLHLWAVANDRARRGEKVFTGAYAIPNGGIKGPKIDAVLYYLKNLRNNCYQLLSDIRKNYNWQSAVEVMSAFPGFGGTGFMVKEVLLDTFKTRLWQRENAAGLLLTLPNDYTTWTPIGPGGRRGAARILGLDRGQGIGLQKAQTVIAYLVAQQQYHWFFRASSTLVPHDVQLQLCEYDKYLRVRLGEGGPRALYYSANQ